MQTCVQMSKMYVIVQFWQASFSVSLPACMTVMSELWSTGVRWNVKDQPSMFMVYQNKYIFTLVIC